MGDSPNFFASLDGLRRDYPAANTIGQTGERAFVEKNEHALLDARLKRSQAFARLKVIGETKAADALYKLHELEDEIRTCVIFKNELPSIERLQDWYRRFGEAREAFLSELSKVR